MSRYPSPALPAGQLSIAWQSASLLLGYPDEQLLARTGLVRDATTLLPDRLGAPLRDFADTLERAPLSDLAEDYVATFDHRKRCCLFLTYFAHGDTRKRGLALLRLKQTYARAGMVLDAAELPDHLCVVLEFGATADVRAAWRILLDSRAGLELLRMSLRDAGSRWAGLVEVVTDTLPPLRGDERAAVARLAAEGPPGEDVGLEPFAPPEYMPTGSAGRGGRA